jgi:hypothetical protein
MLIVAEVERVKFVMDDKCKAGKESNERDEGKVTLYPIFEFSVEICFDHIIKTYHDMSVD